MKITVKGNTNERLEIRKMSRKLRHLSKNGFEIDLMIKSLNNHQEEYLHQSLFTHPFYRDYTTTEREQPQKGAKMNKKQTYVERMLESNSGSRKSPDVRGRNRLDTGRNRRNSGNNRKHSEKRTISGQPEI